MCWLYQLTNHEVRLLQCGHTGGSAAPHCSGAGLSEERPHFHGLDSESGIPRQYSADLYVFAEILPGSEIEVVRTFCKHEVQASGYKSELMDYEEGRV